MEKRNARRAAPAKQDKAPAHRRRANRPPEGQGRHLRFLHRERSGGVPARRQQLPAHGLIPRALLQTDRGLERRQVREPRLRLPRRPVFYRQAVARSPAPSGNRRGAFCQGRHPRTCSGRRRGRLRHSERLPRQPRPRRPPPHPRRLPRAAAKATGATPTRATS